jgi:CheY-like chemotaxis protein
MASFPKTLVVEDDPNTALLLNLAFKKAGVTSPMHFVNDGAEAIQYLGGKELFNNVASSTLPGLMLLSEGGPRLSGFSVLRWLWLRPHLRPSCVVVLSTSNSPKDMAQATLLGADLSNEARRLRQLRGSGRDSPTILQKQARAPRAARCGAATRLGGCLVAIHTVISNCAA